MFAIRNREDLENLEELASLKNKVEEFKQYSHENMKKLFEPVTDTLKSTSEKLTNTVTKTSIKKNKATDNLNGKVLDFMNDKGMIAPYLASFLVSVSKPENKSQFRLLKGLNSTKMIFLFYGVIPVILYSNLLNFRDTNKFFKLDGDLLKTVKNSNFKKCHSYILIYRIEKQFVNLQKK